MWGRKKGDRQGRREIFSTKNVRFGQFDPKNPKRCNLTPQFFILSTIGRCCTAWFAFWSVCEFSPNEAKRNHPHTPSPATFLTIPLFPLFLTPISILTPPHTTQKPLTITAANQFRPTKEQGNHQSHPPAKIRALRSPPPTPIWVSAPPPPQSTIRHHYDVQLSHRNQEYVDAKMR